MGILSVIIDFAHLVIDLVRLINELLLKKRPKTRSNRRPGQR